MSNHNDPDPSHPPPQPAPQTNIIPNTSFQPVPNNQNLSNQQQTFLNQGRSWTQRDLGQQPGQNLFYHPNGINQHPGLLSGQHIAPIAAVNNPQFPGSFQYFIQITPCGGQLAVQAPPVLLNNQISSYAPQQLVVNTGLTAAAAAAQQHSYHPFPEHVYNNSHSTPQPQPAEFRDANAVQPPIDNAVQQHADNVSQQLADVQQRHDAGIELTRNLRTDETEIERGFRKMFDIRNTIVKVKTMINNARDLIDAADKEITMADSAIDETCVSMYMTWAKHKKSCYHLISLPVQKHDSEESSENVDASYGENVVEDSGGGSGGTEQVPSSGPTSKPQVSMSAGDDGSANSLKIDKELGLNRGYRCGLNSPQAIDASSRNTKNSPQVSETGSTPRTSSRAVESTQRVSVPKNNPRGTENPSCEGGQSSKQRSVQNVPPRASTTEQFIPAVLAILDAAEKPQTISATSSSVLHSDPQQFPSLQDAQSIHITRTEKRAQAALTEKHAAVTTDPTPVSTKRKSYASALSAKKPTTQFDIEAALAKTESSKKPTASSISKALEEQKVLEATSTSPTSKPLKALVENVPPRAGKTASATPAVVPKASKILGTRHVQKTKGFVFKPFQKGFDSEEGNKFSRNQLKTGSRFVALPNVFDECRKRKLTEVALGSDENPEPEPDQPSTSGLKPVPVNSSFFMKHLETPEKLVSVTVEEIEEDEVTEPNVSQQCVTTRKESAAPSETKSVEEAEKASIPEPCQPSTPEPRPIPAANLSSSKKKKKSHKKKTVKTDIEKAVAIEKAKMAVHIDFYCKHQCNLRNTDDKETLEERGLGWLNSDAFNRILQKKNRIRQCLDSTSQTQWDDSSSDIKATLELNRKTMFYQVLLSEHGNYPAIIDQDITRIMVFSAMTKSIYLNVVMDYLDVAGWPHLKDYIRHQSLPKEKNLSNQSGLVKELTDARKEDKTEYGIYAEQPFFLKRMNLHSEKADSDKEAAFYAACYGVLDKKSRDTTSDRQLDKIGRQVLNFDFNYLSQLTESAPECIDEKENQYFRMFYFSV